MTENTIPTATCQRCKHIWKKRTETPTICPKCHSPYWNKQRRTLIKKLITDNIKPETKEEQYYRLQEEKTP
jgi:Zn finger protein HypA/HybF involved in hydrogenase expression